MDVFEVLATTRAIRRFTTEPLAGADVVRCLEAAVQGPSGGNIQPWQFVVVTAPETRRAIGDVYRRAYARYEPALLRVRPPARTPGDEARFQRMLAASRHLAEHLGEAPVHVLVLMPSISMTLHDDAGPLDVGTPFASVYPAVQNLMLAARGLGIGTTLTTVFRIYQDEVRALCGIPERYEIVALVPMGRPARGRFAVGRRRPIEQVTHWDRFGARGRAAPGSGAST
jgi:nitroreductase